MPISIRIRSRTVQLKPGDRIVFDGVKYKFYPVDTAVISNSYKYAGMGKYANTKRNVKHAKEFMEIGKQITEDISRARDYFDLTIQDGVKTYTFKNLRVSS